MAATKVTPGGKYHLHLLYREAKSFLTQAYLPLDNPKPEMSTFWINSAVSNFTVIVLCSCRAFALTFQFALVNGGPTAMYYGIILASLGTTAVGCSFAELASMYPAPFFPLGLNVDDVEGGMRKWEMADAKADLKTEIRLLVLSTAGLRT
ncbi:hypothetical protein GQ43DRAFT_468796 [Delitschia confertaspora ATCC 74209]|uniref:Uncharacterized protein n=1 Tax=Delitschia confertaspora ATCC 74209 TaxID=1513339 RepID=A0A9P4JWI9_9PLEO|nr:hypothetical protein GQ43DRAFT_468796 [Delitschia confertaspora ATCC 74209]